MGTDTFIGIVIGFIAWFVVRCLAGGIFTVNQNERAVGVDGDRLRTVQPSATLCVAEEGSRGHLDLR
jgi:hypothetical protein